MIELTPAYKAAAKEFKRVFGYGVPLSMIPPVVETQDLIAQLEECIKNNKDDLLSRYGVKNDTDILY